MPDSHHGEADAILQRSNQGHGSTEIDEHLMDLRSGLTARGQPGSQTRRPAPAVRLQVNGSAHDPMASANMTPQKSSSKQRYRSNLPPTPPSSQHGTLGVMQTFSITSHTTHIPSSTSKKNPKLLDDHNALPTPDITPPHTRDHLDVFRATPSHHYSSSQAESFTTAREDQATPATIDSESNVAEGAMQEWSPAFGHNDTQGTGSSDFNEQDGDVTPVRRSPSAQTKPFVSPIASVYSRRDKNTSSNADDIPDREWGSQLTRNVTVRKRHLRNLSSSPPDEFAPQQSPMDSKFPRPVRETSRERVEAVDHNLSSSSNDRIAPTVGWPAGYDDMLSFQGSHRDSTASSTIVEAVVVAHAQSPSRPRKLRHSKGRSTLRGNSDAILAESRTDSFIHPEPQKLHILKHRNSPLPERIDRMSRGSESSARVISNPERKRPDSIPIEVIPQRGFSLGTSSLFLQYNFDDDDEDDDEVLYESLHQTQSLLPPSSEKAPQFKPTIKEQGRGSGSHVLHYRPQSHKAAVEVYPPMQQTSTNSSEESKISHPLTQSSQESQVVSLPDRPPDDAQPSPTIASANRSLRRTEALLDFQSDEADLDLPLMGTGNMGLHRRRPSATSSRKDSLDRAIARSLEPPRLSVDKRSEPRSSIDRLNAFNSEYAMSRHVNAVTPFSQFSEHTDLEISEATAVSIYPHHNNSLLVIQQGNRQPDTEFDSQPAMITELSDSTISAPMFTAKVDPATPPNEEELGANEVSSEALPYELPRPPTFQIVPPTPNDEDDQDVIVGPIVTRYSAPPPRFSLVNPFSRSYSGKFIRPILTRTGSVKNRHPHQTLGSQDATPHMGLMTFFKRQRSVQQRGNFPTVSDPDQQGNTLHPFWRPRGFWDDLSDSDSDIFATSDPYYDHAPLAGEEVDALPPGGDTSSIHDNEQEFSATGHRSGAARLARPLVGSVRRVSNNLRSATGSLRGNGGFLIGNTLGIGRHGTNSRRVVRLPSTLKKQREEERLRVSKKPSQSSLSSRGYRVGATVKAFREGGPLFGTRGGPRLSPLRSRVQYVGLKGLKDRIRERNERAEEERREKRRRELRQSIGRGVLTEYPLPSEA